MPKQVDYESRRRHIAEAVCDLIDRHGPEGATLRDVAQQAGVSMGAVQRCFATKDEMLAFALQRITERITAQGQEEIGASAAKESAVTLLTATLRTLALIEPHQRRDARILAAFTAHATAISSLAEILCEAHARTRDLLAWLIRYGQRTGEFRDDLDADLEAETLLSLVEGLTSLALLGHRPTVPARGAGQLARAELAHALAFWAARCRAIPGATAPSGTLNPDQALAGIPASPTSPESSPADSPGWLTYPAGPPPRPPRALRPTPATCRAFWTS